MDKHEAGDEEKNLFYPGMQQSLKTEEGHNTNCSDMSTEDHLKTESFDHINIESQRSAQESKNLAECEHNFLQHRSNEELFASDEDSEEYKSSSSSDEAIPGARVQKSEFELNNPSFSEHLDSIPGFYNCDEKISSLLALNELLRFREDEIPVQGTYEDVTGQLNRAILKAESSNCLSSSDSEKLRISPERASISDYDSSQECKQSDLIIEGPTTSCPGPLYHPTRVMESSTAMEEMPQPNCSRHFINPEVSEWKRLKYPYLGVYSMIPSPISSNYINLESPGSSPDSPNSNYFHSSKIHVPILDTPSTSFCGVSKRIRLSSTIETANSPNSKTLQKLSPSLSLSPRSSNLSAQPTKEYRQSNTSSSPSSRTRIKNTSSLSDLPNSSSSSTQNTSPRFSQCQYNRRAHKSSRLSNIDDADSSSDDAKGKVPKKKENRKRRKSFPIQLSDARENQSKLPKKDNEVNVLEKTHSLASSSQHFHKKSLNIEENEPTKFVLRPLEIINSENVGIHTSSRKRLVSISKTSDPDQLSGENKTNKKLRHCKSSEE